MYIEGSTKTNYIDITNMSITKETSVFLTSQTNFQTGYSHYGVKWPVLECSLLESMLWDELLNYSIHKPYNLLLSKSDRFGLPRHFDIKKWSIINFPISGNFIESPMIFVDANDTIIDKTDYQRNTGPILFNARNLHAVLPSNEERIVLSICWKDSFDIILQKYFKNELFKEFTGNYFSYKRLKY